MRSVPCSLRTAQCFRMRSGAAPARWSRIAVALLWVAAGMAVSSARGQAIPPVARLSYVAGGVQITQGEQTLFPHALVNMPLASGYGLETGEDGQAEIEFADGSVARLTPNSAVTLDGLPARDSKRPRTELTVRSGLAYLELNVSDGQRFVVHFGPFTAQPLDNSIFRISLDNAPELAVFVGDVTLTGVPDVNLPAGGSVRLNAEEPSAYTLGNGIAPDTWDQWNQDRDDAIAAAAQHRTEARDLDGDTGNPAWNDLDANGDWYAMDGYGDVWVPSDETAGWDPYGVGAWADYPGWGTTWVSGYSWGWLPYHCGAWNHFASVGWGWVPGQCGLGWAPVGPIWDRPPGYAPPPRPIPGGHIGTPYGGEERLQRVDRGPRSREWRGVHPESGHEPRTIQVGGQTLKPLPPVEGGVAGNAQASAGGQLSYGRHVGAPRTPLEGALGRGPAGGLAPTRLGGARPGYVPVPRAGPYRGPAYGGVPLAGQPHLAPSAPMAPPPRVTPSAPVARPAPSAPAARPAPPVPVPHH